MLATIDATEERLTDERGLVYRYRSHDGLEGEEGTFLLCTFWLAQALARAGQTDRARTVFERAAAFVNDVGLLAEEVDPVSGELLGNFPQAFSHIGLVNAAWAISEAELRQGSPAGGPAPRRPDAVIDIGHRTPAARSGALDFDGERRESDARTGSRGRGSGYRTRRRGAAVVDMKLEVVVVPVSDVDRAKAFYESLGWRLDADFSG